MIAFGNARSLGCGIGRDKHMVSVRQVFQYVISQSTDDDTGFLLCKTTDDFCFLVEKLIDFWQLRLLERIGIPGKKIVENRIF